MTGDCWIWTGETVKGGYGRTTVARRKTLVHRAVYEALIGPIPEGLTLDHLCRNTACYNPAHLEPVTLRENILRSNGLTAQNARKTSCARCDGPLTPKASGGGRVCMSCRAEYFRIYNATRRHRKGPEQIGWARRYNHCQECGTTERPHVCHGRCTRCHERNRDRCARRLGL